MPRFVATWPSFTSRHNGCANVTGGSMHRMLGLWFGDQQLETCPVGRIGGMARHDSAKAWAWRLFSAPDSDDERRIHQDRTGTATRSPGPKTRRVRMPRKSVSHRAASQMRWSTSGPGWPPETQPRADSRAPRKVSRAAAMRPLLCTPLVRRGVDRGDERAVVA